MPNAINRGHRCRSRACFQYSCGTSAFGTAQRAVSSRRMDRRDDAAGGKVPGEPLALLRIGTARPGEAGYPAGDSGLWGGRGPNHDQWTIGHNDRESVNHGHRARRLRHNRRTGRCPALARGAVSCDRSVMRSTRLQAPTRPLNATKWSRSHRCSCSRDPDSRRILGSMSGAVRGLSRISPPPRLT